MKGGTHAIHIISILFLFFYYHNILGVKFALLNRKNSWNVFLENKIVNNVHNEWYYKFKCY